MSDRMKSFLGFMGIMVFFFVIILIADVIATKVNYELGPQRVSFSDVIWVGIGIAVIIIIIKMILGKIK